jgi:2-hydroxycyclohexanecarboxyl-CoA dehydrogenase
MQSLKDRTFVITGGTSDIGRALVLSLSARGADIAILDASPEKGRRLTDEISDNREVKEHHGKAAYFNTDLTNKDAIKESFSRAAETFGAVDILVSAFQQSKISSVFGAEYLADMDKLVEINLKSAVYATHAIVPFMKGRKKGKIIYVVPDLVRWGVEEESLGAISRGGLVYYAKSMARELGQYNITVNCVLAGPTEDYLLSRDPKAVSIKTVEEKLLKRLPPGRTLRATEVAETIAFLSSSGADAVSGQTWSVNAGML